MKERTFENADFYDCRDDSELTSTSPLQELWEYLDNQSCTLLEAIKKSSPVTVEAFSRKKVPESEIKARAEGAAGDAIDLIYEGYGDLDLFRPEPSKKAIEAFETAIRQVVYDIRAWSCEKCGSREYSEEELLKMFKDEIEEEEEIEEQWYFPDNHDIQGTQREKAR